MTPPDTLDLRDEWMLPGKRFPQPDWGPIGEFVEASYDEAGQLDAWRLLGSAWCHRIRSALGGGYRVEESPNFVVVADAADAKVTEVLNFLERCMARIVELRRGIIIAPPVGKCPVIIFSELNDFYQYLGQYIDDDDQAEDGQEYGAVGGVYLSRGYGHFAAPSADLDQYVAVFSHELCHALLAPLELPPWLDEAITTTTENSIAASNPYSLDREMVRRHQAYWNEERMQDFWSGRSFWYADEGQELSYHLARFLLNGLTQGGHVPAEEIDAFILKASRDDAGFSAALEVLDIDLSDPLNHFLGDGNWRPNGPLRVADR